MDVRIPVVIDTDNSLGAPGSEVDDAFAIASALAQPELDIRALTTVHGNAGARQVAELSRGLLLDLGRSEVPVHVGSGRPLVRPVRAGAAEDPDSGEALRVLSDTIRARPGEVVVIALGPLTNLARLFTAEPGLTGLVREVVVMGGVFLRTTGRRDLPGEFNIWVDPDAAQAVFASGAPLRLVGLDVTERVRLTAARAGAMASTPGILGRLGAHAVDWIEASARRRPGDRVVADSCAMHDALAVAAVVRPELFTWRSARLDVETASDLTRGVVVADLQLTARPPRPNARIATDVDVDAALRWLEASLAEAARTAPG